MVPSRKRRGLTEIQLRIAEFKSSGLSKAEFAARLNVHPLSGHLFVFSKQRRHRVKILFWDKSGGWLCAQRLESGPLAWPSSADEVLKLLRMVSATQPRSGGGRSERDCVESQSQQD